MCRDDESTHTHTLGLTEKVHVCRFLVDVCEIYVMRKGKRASDFRNLFLLIHIRNVTNAK